MERLTGTTPAPAVAPQKSDWLPLIAAALTVWMGVHALRSFWSMLVWNVAEDRSPPQIALIALVFWGAGLMAWLAARWLGGSRPVVRLSLLFGLVYTANQIIAHPVATPALGILVGVVWLWLFPTLVVALARSNAVGLLLPGILLGLAAQVALQTALHGLDLPMLHGVGSGMGGLVLGAALYATARAAFPETVFRGSSSVAEQMPGLGLAALGPTCCFSRHCWPMREGSRF